jgi:bifunctional UDP-N-acetylglucosamine pyrophosphorylase / glucosamine-1-phosphate N-acetyltransferase
MSVRAIVLAAGKGTRMRSTIPKALHPVCGVPMIAWVVRAVRGAGIDEVIVVVGEDDGVPAVLPEGVATVVQAEPRGTGHAAGIAVGSIDGGDDDTVLIVPGDSPLMTAGTLRAMLERHAETGAACTLLTTRMPDPTGYGRVVRRRGKVAGIVEEPDADDETRAIDEVAVSTYVFRMSALREALAGLDDSNRQGEYYLTDVVAALVPAGVETVEAPDHSETLGVNSHEQLAAVEAIARYGINRALMSEGVWMADPASVYVDAGVTVEAGARLYPGTHLEGSTHVAAGAQIGPGSLIVDSEIGEGARVQYSVVRGATVGSAVDVGPYASLRPGTVLEDGSKAGTFVEIKKSVVGRGSKVPHLAYLGDATLGEDTNFGAGAITCNYDGFEKHETHIGDRVFIGSDTMLVAPVTVGDGAFTGAGSVITKDVSAGSLAVERSQQREIPGYADRRAKPAESEGD